MNYELFMGEALAEARLAAGRGAPAVGAIAVMKRALAEFTISPIKTTIPLYLEIMDDADFKAGEFDTGFIGRFVPEDTEGEDDED